MTERPISAFNKLGGLYFLPRSIDKIRSEQSFAPRPSALCDWCEFRAHCPAFEAERAAQAPAAAALS